MDNLEFEQKHVTNTTHNTRRKGNTEGSVTTKAINAILASEAIPGTQRASYICPCLLSVQLSGVLLLLTNVDWFESNRSTAHTTKLYCVQWNVAPAAATIRMSRRRVE